MKRHLRKTLALLLVLGLTGSLLGGISTALFTDTAQIQGSSFTTGTIDIDLTDDNETNADNLTNTQLTIGAMAPGDQVQPTGGITVRNNGTLALRYAFYASATDADAKNLKDQLEVTIRAIDVTVPATPCDNFDGAVIYGPTTNIDGATAAGTFFIIFGDSTAGAQAGDRALAAAASEILCFRVKLATSAPNSSQNAATTITWEFRAEQTANN
jgi:predicted ribosomally synthesized peptide with SipW-like signal peptide